MLSLKDNIASDLANFKVDEFIKATEGSVFAAAGILDAVSNLPASVAKLLNNLIGDLNEMLTDLVDVSSIADDLMGLLDNALVNLGLPLEIRSMLKNLLTQICNNTLSFDLNLDKILFSIVLTAAFSVTICGSTFGFKASYEAMLSKDGFIGELTARYEEELADYRNSNLLRSRDSLLEQLSVLEDSWLDRTRNTSDPVLSALITEQSSLDINPATDSATIDRAHELSIELTEALATTNDATLLGIITQIDNVKQQIDATEEIPTELLDILREIKARESYITDIFDTVGLQLINTIGVALAAGTIDEETALMVLTEILETVGDNITVKLGNYFNNTVVPTVNITLDNMLAEIPVTNTTETFDISTSTAVAMALVVLKYYDGCSVLPPVLAYAVGVYNTTQPAVLQANPSPITSTLELLGTPRSNTC